MGENILNTTNLSVPTNSQNQEDVPLPRGSVLTHITMGIVNASQTLFASAVLIIYEPDGTTQKRSMRIKSHFISSDGLFQLNVLVWNGEIPISTQQDSVIHFIGDNRTAADAIINCNWAVKDAHE